MLAKARATNLITIIKVPNAASLVRVASLPIPDLRVFVAEGFQPATPLSSQEHNVIPGKTVGYWTLVQQAGNVVPRRDDLGNGSRNYPEADATV
jgi:hypothetical protein